MFSKKEFSVNPTDVFGFHWDVRAKTGDKWEGRKKPVLIQGTKILYLDLMQCYITREYT